MRKAGDAGDTAALEDLLEYLKRHRGIDLSEYKRASLARRIEKRMHAVGVADYGDYAEYLAARPEESSALVSAILINVTGFFRDAAAWELLATDVLPALLARMGKDEPIRVWSAGCATGEEAYGLAMLLAALLGEEDYRRRVKIFGTDVDPEAIAIARAGTYDGGAVEAVPAAFRERFIERAGDRYTIRKELRQAAIFGRHDLLMDAPISRIDVLACRNALMYFSTDAQARVLARFRFALRDGGILFLGRAETMAMRAGAFTAVDFRRRIFTTAPVR